MPQAPLWPIKNVCLTKQKPKETSKKCYCMYSTEKKYSNNKTRTNLNWCIRCCWIYNIYVLVYIYVFIYIFIVPLHLSVLSANEPAQNNLWISYKIKIGIKSNVKKATHIYNNKRTTTTKYFLIIWVQADCTKAIV